MGRRGPAPMPANVHLLRGNPSKLSAAQLGAGVNPEIEIPGCPKHLLPEARKEWKRITPELEKLGLIAKIDRAALALYCQTWARWVWFDEQLQRAMRLADEGAQAAAEKGSPWTGGDGFMIPTPNGSFTYSPYWVGANKAIQQLDRLKNEFGLSPSARGRVTASSNQLPLPGIPNPGDAWQNL